MKKCHKIIEICARILILIWYGSIIAAYLWALILAASIEIPDLVGVVLVLWPLVLVLSVKMAKDDAMDAFPCLIERQIDGWGRFALPKRWQMETGDVLICRDESSHLCAVLCKDQQANKNMEISMPDHSMLTIRISQKGQPKFYDGAVRCHYAVGRQKGWGYIAVVQEENPYLFAVVLDGSLVGKKISQALQTKCDS